MSYSLSINHTDPQDEFHERLPCISCDGLAISRYVADEYGCENDDCNIYEFWLENNRLSQYTYLNAEGFEKVVQPAVTGLLHVFQTEERERCTLFEEMGIE